MKKTNKILIAAVVSVMVLMALYFFSNIESISLNRRFRENTGHSFIRLTDGYTEYEAAGPRNGQAVILLHGATVPYFIWDKQFKTLADAGFRVIRYSQFGKGLSDRPELTYDRELYVKQLNDLIEKLDLKEPVDLIGLSFGAAVVMDFAAEYDKKVSGIILISPVINSIVHDGGIKIGRVPLLGDYLMRIITVPIITARASKLFKGSDYKVKDYLSIFSEQTKIKGFSRALLSMFRSDAIRDHSAEYGIVGTKKHISGLILRGSRDSDISIEMINSMMVLLPKFKYIEIRNGDHNLTLKNSESINPLIINYLQKKME